MLKVIKVSYFEIEFENGLKLYSEHEKDCCESHYLDFSNLTIDDFEDLYFDLSSDEFFIKVDGYGILLMPVSGRPVPIPGYGYNNGYYSTELTLTLSDGRRFDVSECQVISE